MFKLSEVLRVNEDNEIVAPPAYSRIIPYDLYIELAAMLGCLPSEEQQRQFERQHSEPKTGKVGQ